jgi:hypothetical protein
MNNDEALNWGTFLHETLLRYYTDEAFPPPSSEPAPEIVPEITPHPSHDMWWRRPDSGECENCAMCTCCDGDDVVYGPCKAFPATENP